MAATYRSASTATFASGADVSIAKPSGAVQGDLLVLFVSEASGSFNLSGGDTYPFTEGTGSPSQDATPDLQARYAYRIVGASDPATYSVALDGNTSGCATLIRIDGHDAVTPIRAATPNSEDVSTTAWETGSVTPGSADDLLIAFATADGNTGHAIPQWAHNSGAGWSEAADFREEVSYVSQGVAYKGAGSTSSQTHAWTKTDSDVGPMFIVAVATAAAAAKAPPFAPRSTYMLRR